MYGSNDCVATPQAPKENHVGDLLKSIMNLAYTVRSNACAIADIVGGDSKAEVGQPASTGGGGLIPALREIQDVLLSAQAGSNRARSLLGI